MEAGDISAPVRIVLKIALQSLRQRRGLAAGWLRPLPYRINDTGFASPPPAVIKPGLWPSSKLLFPRDKSILQSGGQMAIWLARLPARHRP